MILLLILIIEIMVISMIIIIMVTTQETRYVLRPPCMTTLRPPCMNSRCPDLLMFAHQPQIHVCPKYPKQFRQAHAVRYVYALLWETCFLLWKQRSDGLVLMNDLTINWRARTDDLNDIVKDGGCMCSNSCNEPFYSSRYERGLRVFTHLEVRSPQIPETQRYYDVTLSKFRPSPGLHDSVLLCNQAWRAVDRAYYDKTFNGNSWFRVRSPLPCIIADAYGFCPPGCFLCEFRPETYIAKLCCPLVFAMYR
jgi:hypothetical protein